MTNQNEIMSKRFCVECGHRMLMIKCGPAFANQSMNVYKCSDVECLHTEKVTVVDRSFLTVCSNPTRRAN